VVPDVRNALLVDYGGVLTTSVSRSFRAFCVDLGLPSELAKEAFVEAYSGDGDAGPVHRMETGEISVDEFSVGLAEVLSRRSGVQVPHEGLIGRLFALMEPDEVMLTAVAAARREGVRTGLLSNSWGVDAYPRERFGELFDVVVISGEVGLRKPDPAIFALAAERIGTEAADCVFVDDLEANIVAAEATGMTGILHRRAETTVPRMAQLLGLNAQRLAS
jgi:putative hydrolase of the HAD superfamily